MGHIHLFVKDVDAQKTFWTDIMGGRIVDDNGMEEIQFPGVFIVLTKTNEDRRPPASSIVNHFGLVVRDMPGMLAKWRANNLRIEPTENPNEAYVMAPDGIKLEVYGIPELPVPVQMNHIHYYISDIPGIQAWYVKVFGAKPGQRPCIACISKPRMIDIDNLPGVNLSFAPGASTLVGTKGSSLDHIGFEVTDLESFVKKLEAMGVKLDSPIQQLPNRKTKIAFLTDPWGTYIELTEGL